MSFRIRRIDPITEPALDGVRWDYADTFEVLLDQPDDHPAEQWVRAALEQSSGPVRHLIPLVHRNIVRFNLDLDDPDNLLGWHQIVSEHDSAAIEADGSLLRAVVVARRHTPTRCTGSTYLFFHKPTAARLMWLFVRPLHLQLERQLLAGAARALTQNHADVSTRS
jgi:hypothetical protein